MRLVLSAHIALAKPDANLGGSAQAHACADHAESVSDQRKSPHTLETASLNSMCADCADQLLRITLVRYRTHARDEGLIQLWSALRLYMVARRMGYMLVRLVSRTCSWPAPNLRLVVRGTARRARYFAQA